MIAIYLPLFFLGVISVKIEQPSGEKNPTANPTITRAIIKVYISGHTQIINEKSTVTIIDLCLFINVKIHTLFLVLFTLFIIYINVGNFRPILSANYPDKTDPKKTAKNTRLA